MSRSLPSAILVLLCALAVLFPGTAGLAHPANIAGAQAKVEQEGRFQIRARFDLLAFALDDTPQRIGDTPMNALLDGPDSAMAAQLAEAKGNFQRELLVSAGSAPATIDSIEFPTSTDVRKWAVEGGATRLPVMLPVVINGHLPPNAATFSVRFPEVLGTVVLTTELPYQEPVSEPLDAGAWSTPLNIPTPQQIAAAQAADLAPRSLPLPSPLRSRVPKAHPVATAYQAASQREGGVHHYGPQDLGVGSPPQPLPGGEGLSDSGNALISRFRPTPSPPARQRVLKGRARPGLQQPFASWRSAKQNKPLAEANGPTLRGGHEEGSDRANVPAPKPLPTLRIAKKGEPVAKANAPSHSKPVGGREGIRMGLNAPPWYTVIFKYVKMGYRHILPEGLDHILFVLGLVLLSKKTKALLWQITAFTVAHSITLALSLYGIVRLPPTIVEPIIAASIAFVAIENIMTTDLKPWRPFVVFAFGLVHGMGFAGALKDLGLARHDFLTALVGFNVGVELGQLSVVAMALLAIGWFRSHASYRKMIVIPGSAVIAAIAVFWTIQRTL